METRIKVLATKLQRLRKIDRQRVVFGASEHGYETKPWSKSDIEQLSLTVGTELPGELSMWLLSVGSGAGPNYELTPTYSDPVDRSPYGGEFHGAFQQLIDVRLDDLQGLIDDAFAKPRNPSGYLEIPKITTKAIDGGPGLLSLGFAGCGYDFVTPLYGELKGKIFYRTEETIDDQGIDHGSVLWPQGFCRIYPSDQFRKDAKPTYCRSASDMFSFLDWIAYWLDTSIYFIENYDEYERQLNDWREENLGWRDKPPSLLKRLKRKFGAL